MQEGHISPDEPVDLVKRGYTFFTQIQPELRPLEQLLNLPNLRPEIEKFIQNLPTLHFQANVLSLGWESTLGLGDDPLQSVLSLSRYYGNELFTIRQHFRPTGQLFDILFALFSGRTVIVNSKNQEAAQSLADRFSLICPFNRRFPVFTEPDSEIGPGIVVAFDRHDQGAVVVTLDHPQIVFEGPKCPDDSIVRREMLKDYEKVVDSENSLLWAAAIDAKRLFGRFQVKLLELAGRNVRTEERVVAGLRYRMFAPSDAPIVRCWAREVKSPEAMGQLFVEEPPKSPVR
jgi:hypothetical protein